MRVRLERKYSGIEYTVAKDEPGLSWARPTGEDEYASISIEVDTNIDISKGDRLHVQFSVIEFNEFVEFIISARLRAH